VTYSTSDNLTTQGSAKSVTAVGGFLYTSAGVPATGVNGYHVRIWPSSAGASCSSGTPVLDVASDNDGYYFAGPLAANVQYFVQVCKGTTAGATLTLPHKLANGEFIEEDFSGLP
jgi:hypothetical protein